MCQRRGSACCIGRTAYGSSKKTDFSDDVSKAKYTWRKA